VAGEEQLQWERDNARLAAIGAALSAILAIAAGLYLTSKIQSGSDDDAIDQIKLIHAHKTDLVISSVIQGISTALLAIPLYYLFRATRLRRPQLPAGIRFVILLAPILGGVTSVIHQIQTAKVTDKIVAQLPLNVKIAEDRIKDEVGHGAIVAVGGIGTAAALGIAFMFTLISLNAMRAGLLSRFMGILGIIVGVLVVIPLQGQLPFPVVQVFWLGALAVLFLDRWPPPGRGPAWESTEAIPWPTAQERRDELSGGPAEPRPARGGWGARARTPEPVEQVEVEDEDAAEDPHTSQHTREAARPRESPTHPRSKKRKRKRR
jgi:hypothetical protein